MNPLLVVAIQEAPTIIDLLTTLFQNKHPDEPAPTSEEVMAALEAAFESSRSKDEAWLKAHPPQPKV